MPRKRLNTYDGLKWCPHCTSYRRVADFGMDATRDDGLNGWCRRCRAGEEKRRRAGDLQKYRDDMNERYRQHPARFKAHVYVARALAAGRLTKPTSCPVCARQRKIEAHHHAGYARENWLNVVWRCRQCHALGHKRSHAESTKVA